MISITSGGKALSYYVRLMRREDVAQVTAIDREAFPALWPPANYQKELDNRLAHYIVVCDSERQVELISEEELPDNRFLRVLFQIGLLFNRDRFFGEPLPPLGTEYVVGFCGIWMMVDEAHITSIAVRNEYLGRGIGELLLILLIGLVAELKAHLITLEVRQSNTVAQKLYEKYGFDQVGVRRGYYSDNHEDGLLLSTEDITSDGFLARLEELRQAHEKRWGTAIYKLGWQPSEKI